MEEEEVDYMSDDFLASCLGTNTDGSGDVRPGLLRNRREQREHELMKQRKNAAELKKKPTEVCQAEALHEGLNQPISSTNKGFSMLEKMGFKSGMGLGKNNCGIVEPIGITIKNNKLGLGRKAPQKVEKPKSKVENKLEQLNEKDFMAFHSRKDRERKIVSDLRKSQRICKELDQKDSKNEPKETWFWPDEPKTEEDLEDNQKEDDDDELRKTDEVELSDEDKLEMLTRYLRENYYYCIWCTVQYNDENDMKECPGCTRDDH